MKRDERLPATILVTNTISEKNKEGKIEKD